IRIKEQKHSPARLRSDNSFLFLVCRHCEQQAAFPGALRSDDHPALVIAERRVLDEREPELLRIITNGLVVVVHNDGHQADPLPHGLSPWKAAGGLAEGVIRLTG